MEACNVYAELSPSTNQTVILEDIFTNIGTNATQYFPEYINFVDNFVPGHCGPIEYEIVEDLPFISLNQ